MKNVLITLFCFVSLTLLSSASAPLAGSAFNPQCEAIAKSTKKQCKNRQWGKCEKVLCYVHCR
ncbi:MULTISPECIES: hypothetical protein [Rufibacter]|uniref:Uncharacterized protein n=1 Tax=Rufibacter quisquiliarum TaxID=1549639 RepID=A0A839GDH3_9BACT|nr:MULTISPECIES: hypothetical protein [Rufibacter]MBA9076962.1 hypothetical protein [Rufibacter quisquiliarum]